MDYLDLFCTPVVVFSPEGLTALDRELASRLVAESRRSPGIRRSNAGGGWHSLPDLSLRREACYGQLFQYIVDRVEATMHEIARRRGASLDQRHRFALQAWGMVMHDGHYTILHNHAQAHWSVVYYVDAGDVDTVRFPESGCLSFVDPRIAGTAIPGIDLMSSQCSVTPATGMLVVFPGWLQHYVHPYRGQRPRISISCNLRVEVKHPTGASPCERTPE